MPRPVLCCSACSSLRRAHALPRCSHAVRHSGGAPPTCPLACTCVRVRACACRPRGRAVHEAALLPPSRCLGPTARRQQQQQQRGWRGCRGQRRPREPPGGGRGEREPAVRADEQQGGQPPGALVPEPRHADAGAGQVGGGVGGARARALGRGPLVAGVDAGSPANHSSAGVGGPSCASSSRAIHELVACFFVPHAKCRYRKLEDAPGASLDLSRDGRFIGVGTAEGSAMVGAWGASPELSLTGARARPPPRRLLPLPCHAHGLAVPPAPQPCCTHPCPPRCAPCHTTPAGPGRGHLGHHPLPPQRPHGLQHGHVLLAPGQPRALHLS